MTPDIKKEKLSRKRSRAARKAAEIWKQRGYHMRLTDRQKEKLKHDPDLHALQNRG